MTRRSFQIRLFFVISGIISHCSCATVNRSANPISKDTISFGYFGGFAGSYTEFILYPSGELLKRSSLDGKLEILPQIDPKIASQSFLIAQDLIGKFEVKDPGNLSYFLKLVSDNEPTFEAVWGGNKKNVSARLQTLYSNLDALCKDRNPVM